MRLKGSDVTVVMPTIDGREDLAQRALASVIRQQVQPGDVIIQHDHHREGAAATRNRALTHVKTPLVAWLDDDDELLPNHIRVLVRAFNHHPGIDLAYTYAEFVGPDGAVDNRSRVDGGLDPLGCWHHGQLLKPDRLINQPFDSETEFALRRDGNHIPVTYMVRTESVRAVDGFPEANTFGVPVEHSGDCEDFGLLLRLMDAKYRFHHVTGVRTWRYHLHDANTGGRGAHRLHELQEHP